MRQHGEAANVRRWRVNSLLNTIRGLYGAARGACTCAADLTKAGWGPCPSCRARFIVHCMRTGKPLRKHGAHAR